MSRRDLCWTLAFWVSLVAVALVATVVLGCAASGRVNVPTSQPVDVEQLSGQIVAKIAPELNATVAASVETNVQGIGYTSYFGIGATACVLVTLTLTIWLSHRREMVRLKGK